MWVNPAKIPPEGLDIEISKPPGDSLLETGDVKVCSPIELKGRLDKVEKDVIIRGNLKTGVEITCSRCLAPFHLPIAVRMEVEFRIREKDPDEEEVELKEENIEVYYYTRNEIDLSDAVKDQVLLAIPMKPLCHEDCKGLCKQCGADLNDGPCDCPGEDIDPRLQVLKTLKKELKEQK